MPRPSRLRLPEQRTDLSQVVPENRDPALIAGSAEMLQDHRRWHPVVNVQHLDDRTAKRIQLGPHRLAPIPGRLPELEEPSHRVTAHPQLVGDLRLRSTLPVRQPVNLSPILLTIGPGDQLTRMEANCLLPAQPLDWCSCSINSENPNTHLLNACSEGLKLGRSRQN